MGWLFGGKKKVPFPEGKTINESALRFSVRSPEEKVIQPEKIKEAAGVEKPFFFAHEEPTGKEPATHLPLTEESPLPENLGPLYIKMDIYQRILGEIQELHVRLNELQQVNQHLETSEYNEEGNFVKLRRAVKNLHDGILQVDKILFKG